MAGSTRRTNMHYADLSSEGCCDLALRTQLRTDHVPLQAVHRFKLEDSPICKQCKREPETVIHYIKYCTAYKDQRQRLKRDIGPENDVGIELLGDKDNIRHLFKYVKDTGCFTDSHGDLEMPLEDQDKEHELAGGGRAWA
ncbi:hypothetical protein BDZ97DRAFT_1761002 [Flammula alnicola]|nr:hypothetical protein BDZ97DRAFT_1761002 [Flammula alnicola]